MAMAHMQFNLIQGYGSMTMDARKHFQGSETDRMPNTRIQPQSWLCMYIYAMLCCIVICAAVQEQDDGMKR